MLVADETRRTGGVSEGIVAALLDAGFDGRLARVTSKDSFIPLGDASRLVLLSEDEIEAAALRLLDDLRGTRCKAPCSRKGRGDTPARVYDAARSANLA